LLHGRLGELTRYVFSRSVHPSDLHSIFGRVHTFLGRVEADTLLCQGLATDYCSSLSVHASERKDSFTHWRRFKALTVFAVGGDSFNLVLAFKLPFIIAITYGLAGLLEGLGHCG